MSNDEQELILDLLVAYESAAKRKRNTTSCLRFNMCIEDEIVMLAQSISEGSYKVSPCICFIATEPVKREIIAADFRDRVVHHYICSFLEPFLEKQLIYDCYSCREGKGTLFGVNRLEHHIRSCSRNYTLPCYVLQLDIAGYFMHINRELLYKKAMLLMDKIAVQKNENGVRMAQTGRYKWIKDLLRVIIFHDPMEDAIFMGDPALRKGLPPSKSLLHSPPGCGLPIGNLTSQLFSNLYLNDFDNYIKRELKVKHYGRYVDDFYLVHNDPSFLKSLVSPIKNELKNKFGLDLHPNKVVLQEAKKGVTFLGVHLKPHRRYLSQFTKKRIQKGVSLINKTPLHCLKQKQHREKLLASANSYLGVMNATTSFKMRKKVFRESILFKVAYGTSFMRKFVLKRDVNLDE